MVPLPTDPNDPDLFHFIPTSVGVACAYSEFRIPTSAFRKTMNPPLPVRNPRTGIADYEITPPTTEELGQVCANVRQAQPAWQQLGVEGRIEVMQQWKQALLDRQEAIVAALVGDTGRLAESVMEVDGVISSLDRWCRLTPQFLTADTAQPTAMPTIQLQQQWVPYPLVGIISPWNFPLLLSLIDAIPALLAGCGAIVKPSEITPRFVEPLMETLAAVPELRSVLGYIQGAGETGAALIEQVDLVCFTGSVATGRKVAAAAAGQFVPAFLELGGKDPAIVLESANLDLATSALLWGSVVNTGQSCLSIERIYVAEAVFEEFVDRLVAKAQTLKLAYPNPEDGQIGPIIAEFQAKIIAEHLRDAAEKGAAIRCGGKVEERGGGWWCPPTVLTGVSHQMKVMTEETFGPIMPVMPFATVEEAIRLANDSDYGLSGAVFAGSEAEALAIASKIDAGGISINDAGLTGFIHEGEKNSFKFSGLGGSRMGVVSLRRFLRRKALFVKTASVANPWWF